MKRRSPNKDGLKLPTTPIDIPVQRRFSVDSSNNSMECSPSVPDSPIRSIGTQTPTASFSFHYPPVTDDRDGNQIVSNDKQLQSTVNSRTYENCFALPEWLRTSDFSQITPKGHVDDSERLSSSLEGIGKQLRIIADDFDRTRAYRSRSKSFIREKF